MSKLPPFLLAFVSLTLGASLSAVDLSPAKSGIVEYELSTSGMGTQKSGKKTQWIADMGAKQASRTQESSVTKIFGVTQKEETDKLSILDGDTSYDIDMKARTGTKANIAQIQNFAAELAKSQKLENKDPEVFLREWVEKNGGRMLGKRSILGKECLGFEIMGVQSWIYRQFTLLSEGTLMGVTIREKATRFEENAKIGADVFKVPAGIQIEQAPDMGALFGGGSAADENAEAAGVAEALAQISAGKPVVTKDAASLSLSLEDFQKMVGKLSIPGAGKPLFMHDRDMLTAAFRKPNDLGTLITVTRHKSLQEVLREAREEGEPQSNTKPEEFSYKGRKAYYWSIPANEEEGTPATSMVLVLDLSRNLNLSVATQPAEPRANLEKLISTLGF